MPPKSKVIGKTIRAMLDAIKTKVEDGGSLSSMDVAFLDGLEKVCKEKPFQWNKFQVPVDRHPQSNVKPAKKFIKKTEISDVILLIRNKVAQNQAAALVEKVTSAQMDNNAQLEALAKIALGYPFDPTVIDLEAGTAATPAMKAEAERVLKAHYSQKIKDSKNIDQLKAVIAGNYFDDSLPDSVNDFIKTKLIDEAATAAVKLKKLRIESEIKQKINECEDPQQLANLATVDNAGALTAEMLTDIGLDTPSLDVAKGIIDGIKQEATAKIKQVIEAKISGITTPITKEKGAALAKILTDHTNVEAANLTEIGIDDKLIDFIKTKFDPAADGYGIKAKLDAFVTQQIDKIDIEKADADTLNVLAKYATDPTAVTSAQATKVGLPENLGASGATAQTAATAKLEAHLKDLITHCDNTDEVLLELHKLKGNHNFTQAKLGIPDELKAFTLGNANTAIQAEKHIKEALLNKINEITLDDTDKLDVLVKLSKDDGSYKTAENTTLGIHDDLESFAQENLKEEAKAHLTKLLKARIAEVADADDNSTLKALNGLRNGDASKYAKLYIPVELQDFAKDNLQDAAKAHLTKLLKSRVEALVDTGKDEDLEEIDKLTKGEDFKKELLGLPSDELRDFAKDNLQDVAKAKLKGLLIERINSAQNTDVVELAKLVKGKDFNGSSLNIPDSLKDAAKQFVNARDKSFTNAAAKKLESDHPLAFELLKAAVLPNNDIQENQSQKFNTALKSHAQATKTVMKSLEAIKLGAKDGWFGSSFREKESPLNMGRLEKLAEMFTSADELQIAGKRALFDTVKDDVYEYHQAITKAQENANSIKAKLESEMKDLRELIANYPTKDFSKPDGFDKAARSHIEKLQKQIKEIEAELAKNDVLTKKVKGVYDKLRGIDPDIATTSQAKIYIDGDLIDGAPQLYEGKDITPQMIEQKLGVMVSRPLGSLSSSDSHWQDQKADGNFYLSVTQVDYDSAPNTTESRRIVQQTSSDGKEIRLAGVEKKSTDSQDPMKCLTLAEKKQMARKMVEAWIKNNGAPSVSNPMHVTGKDVHLKASMALAAKEMCAEMHSFDDKGIIMDDQTRSFTQNPDFKRAYKGERTFGEWLTGKPVPSTAKHAPKYDEKVLKEKATGIGEDMNLSKEFVDKKAQMQEKIRALKEATPETPSTPTTPGGNSN